MAASQRELVGIALQGEGQLRRCPSRTGNQSAQGCADLSGHEHEAVVTFDVASLVRDAGRQFFVVEGSQRSSGDDNPRVGKSSRRNQDFPAADDDAAVGAGAQRSAANHLRHRARGPADGPYNRDRRERQEHGRGDRRSVAELMTAEPEVVVSRGSTACQHQWVTAENSWVPGR